MSLAQKYTWSDFLKAHPEHKKKKLKRTSPEGEKVFKAAFKAYAKNYLKERGAKTEKEIERVSTVKQGFVEKLKAVDGKKWHLRARSLNKKVGRLDAYLGRLASAQEATKQLSKKI